MGGLSKHCNIFEDDGKIFSFTYAFLRIIMINAYIYMGSMGYISHLICTRSLFSFVFI